MNGDGQTLTLDLDLDLAFAGRTATMLFDDADRFGMRAGARLGRRPRVILQPIGGMVFSPE